ncbi:hypothetical protein VNI00_017734, partial [Paramarasmius palmivorus]
IKSGRTRTGWRTADKIVTELKSFSDPEATRKLHRDPCSSCKGQLDPPKCFNLHV